MPRWLPDWSGRATSWCCGTGRRTRPWTLAERLGPMARVAQDPAAAVAGCGFVLSVFADGGTTCAVLLDAIPVNCLASRCGGVRPGNQRPRCGARPCRPALEHAGVGFVDAPVSGSVPTVLAGEILVMASGEEADESRSVRS